MPKAQNAEIFKNILRKFLNENLQKSFETPRGAFRARKTLQKFEYSVLRLMRDFFRTSASSQEVLAFDDEEKQ